LSSLGPAAKPAASRVLPYSSTIRSIFIDNQHDQGMLYFFKEDFPLSELLTRMRAYVANPGNPEAVRVSMLANYFSIQPVHPSCGIMPPILP